MGWASGFQAGSQMAKTWLDTYRETEERKKLQEAQGLTPTQIDQRVATPEEIGRAQEYTTNLQNETLRGMGLVPEEETRYQPTMPQEGQRVGLSTYKLGGQTQATPFTEDQITNARYRAMADVIAARDPIAAARLRQGISAEERAVAAEGRAQKEFETGQELRGLQISGARRTEEAASNLAKFDADLSAAAQQDPSIMNSPERMLELAVKNKLSQSQIQDVTARMAGVRKSTLEFIDADLKAKFQKAGSLDGVLDLDKSDSMYNPGKHHVKRQTKDGIVLDLVDDATGKVVSSSKAFKNDADAMNYLFVQASSPWTQAAVARQIEKDEASLDLSRAQAGLARGRTEALTSSLATDRLNLTGLSGYGRIVAGRLDTLEKTINNPTEFKRLPLAQQKAMIAERNDLNNQLAQINDRLRTSVGIRSEQPSVPSGLDAALEFIQSSGRKFTDAEKKEFTQRFGVPFPEQGKPAPGIRTGGPMSPRTPSSGNAMFPSRGGLGKGGATQAQMDEMTLPELQEYNRSGKIPQRLQ